MATRRSRGALVFAIVSIALCFAVTGAAQERPAPKKKVGKVVAVSGAGIFLVGYAPAAWMGVGGAVALCPTFGRGEGVGSCALTFGRWAIPVAAPYIYLGEEGVHDGFDRLVVADAILQTVGAAAFVTGIAIDLATPAASKDRGAARVDVVPMIGGAMSGAAVVGSF